MAITDYHRLIFDKLEAYRKAYPEVGFTYALRQKKSEKRKRDQYLFIGNDKYISVGLYKPISNLSKTRSIHLIFFYDSNLDVIKKVYLILVYRDDKFDQQLKFYESIMQKIGPDKFWQDSLREHSLEYKGLDWKESIRHYLTDHKPVIDNLLNEHNLLESYHIPEEELEKSIRLLHSATSSEEQRSYWKYSPGTQGSRWQSDLNEGSMSINFQELATGSLLQYTNNEDLERALGFQPGMSNQSWNMMLFRDARIGDVVFANKGKNIVLGIGIVSGPYEYRDSEDFRHYRTVNWIADQPWTYQQGLFGNNAVLFRPDTFTPTNFGPQILREYVKAYPQYEATFRRYNLLTDSEPGSFLPHQPVNFPKNTILYGPPGTGKTYSTIDRAVQITDPINYQPGNHEANKKWFDALLGDRIEFVTFHQNYTYEDFVMGIRPMLSGTTLAFERHEGIFYKIVKKARQSWENSLEAGIQTGRRPFEEVFEEFIKPLAENDTPVPVTMMSGLTFKLFRITERTIFFEKANRNRSHSLSIQTLKEIYEGLQNLPTNGLKAYYQPLSEKLLEKGRIETMSREPLRNYVLVIDEINRANMSRVFGELMTLLEGDKRLGEPNALTLTLPTGERFSLPPNLYLIGTMNTADKSLALLDVALRRRFTFEGLYPKYDGIEDLDPDMAQLLKKLNAAIYKQKSSADFLIGHAYFIGKKQGELKSVFDNRIIPLLLEYFNGRTPVVQEILNAAGIPTIQNPDTYQLEMRDDV